MVMATVYVKCGEYDRAIDQLEELLEQRSYYTVNNLKLNSELDPLRELPRYKEMIARYTEDMGT